MGLIFDTTEFIAMERQRRDIADILLPFSEEEEIGISVVTVAELQHGVRRAKADSQLRRRRRVMSDAMAIFKVHHVTTEIALKAGDLDAELAAGGNRQDFADVLIAATVLVLGFGLVTANPDHFEHVPGLKLISPRR